MNNSPASIKVLFLGFNPKGYVGIDINQEVNAIRRVLKKSRIAVDFDHFVNLEFEELRSEVSDSKADIIHFSCHGDDENIIICDEKGEDVEVPREILHRLLEGKNTQNIKCIVLNACNSKDNAQVLRKTLYLDYAIGMNGNISDATATSFSAAFYRALGNGESIKKSFWCAMDRMSLDKKLDCNIPLLIDSDECYVTRNEEQELFDAIKTQILIRVKGDKKIGKSTLINHVTKKLSPNKYRIVSLYIPDSYSKEKENVDDESLFLKWFCEEIAQQLNLPDYCWEGNGEDFLEYTPARQCNTQFEKYFLPSPNSTILIIHLKNFDKIYDKRNVFECLHGLFIGWAKKNENSDPIWSGFRFILEHRDQTYPENYQGGSILWSTGKAIELKYFNTKEVQSLLEKFELPTELNDHLMEHLNGHPYLVNLTLEHFRKIQEKQADSLKNIDIAQITQISEYLSSYVEILKNNSKLKKVFQDILSESKSEGKIDSEVKQLLRLGLIISVGDIKKPSCKLYTEYFRMKIPPDIPPNGLWELIKRIIKLNHK
ncbi:AAA-like domain-containing protein [Dolichospermum sp. UHCC 0259]|uniref:AAA-like domain-containing protein n=1 Tax=Dolichospermum sp. UHCC 0259 TaxID=2590010 RepID=UPI001447C789|nr:AAA-like domain-containing protein [Dolichospermum sp. UHCC 0259]MTJ50434.1 CHAT domain-containing protein [Dolichospermum sp. UHCC 0259]